MVLKYTTEKFIDRAIIVHENKYVYTKSIYLGATTKLIIICPIHGEFPKTPDGHINAKSGCPQCGYLKSKQTNLARYGVEYPLQSKEIHNKTKQSCLINNGVEYPLQSKKCRDKAKTTRVELYGNENYLNSDVGVEQRANIMQEKYGTVHALQIVEFKDKLIRTNKNKYGREYSHQQHISYEDDKKLNDKDWLYEQHYNKKLNLTEISNILGVSTGTIGRHFRILGIEVLNLSHSLGEKEVLQYIQTLNDNITSNSRSVISPLELDIYLPDYNLAIEYNGTFWHSELCGIDKNYHINKTIQCNNKNIRLIHIFDTEWELKQEIVKSRLSSLLGNNNIIYARKCIIVKLTSKQSSVFFNETHIQGNAGSSICYGLEYNNELVVVMSFGKSRFNKDIEYELVRFANKLYTNVIGGASRLFKYFIKTHQPASIISYSDKRWNTGNVYLQLGFKYLHTSTPNYFYFHNTNSYTLLSRQQFQKHKLKDKLEIFDPVLTEWENMQNNGYNRIWDCGNDVYIYK
jgi:hypothetical protein